MRSDFWMFWSLFTCCMYLWSEWRRSRLKRLHREVLTAQQALYKTQVDECVALRRRLEAIGTRLREIPFEVLKEERS